MSSPYSGEHSIEKEETGIENSETELKKELASTSVNQPAPSPDGGLRAWLQVAGSFFLFFNTWGLLNTFGVFQTYYESGVIFRQSSSNISWIGAIQAYLVYAVALLSGPIYDRGYLRPLVAVGSFMIVFGLMMLSICHTFWQTVLAQGFVIGIGAGCLFVPSVAVLPQYFSTRLGLAVGIASSGSSLGGIVYPIVLYRLISQVGFGWSVRVLGFIALGTLLLPLVVLRLRTKPGKIRALLDPSAFTDGPYLLFTLAAMLGFIGMATMLFYISFYAENQKITESKMAFYILPIFNAASCFGRTIPNWLSDTTGPINLIAPGAMVFGILALSMPAVTSTAGLIVLAIFSGFFSGVYIALPPVCFMALTKDKSKIGTRMGMGFTFCGFGLLIGGPGAGAILGSHGSLNWTGLWVFAGVFTCASAVLFSAVRVIKVGFNLKTKA